MKNYKIAVLVDFSIHDDVTIKNSVGLAKMIQGDVSIFGVKKPLELVNKENQLSAIRTLNQNYNSTHKTMKQLAKSLSFEHGVAIDYSFAIGNVKNEIRKFFKEQKPDIIVLGRKKSSRLKFFGDGIIKFVLDIFEGVVMIASNQNILDPNKEISLGLLNETIPSSEIKFAENILAKVKKPLKSFNILKKEDIAQTNATPSREELVEYTFEHNDNAISNLSNYLQKNKIDMLYVDRKKGKKNDKITNVKKVIDKLDVTLLMTSK